MRIQSGIEQGVTLGTPIGLMVLNKDQRPHDYSETDLYPRPSHADWTYLEKYGVKASSGGGRSSARETIGTPTYADLCFPQNVILKQWRLLRYSRTRRCWRLLRRSTSSWLTGSRSSLSFRLWGRSISLRRQRRLPHPPRLPLKPRTMTTLRMR